MKDVFIIIKDILIFYQRCTGTNEYVQFYLSSYKSSWFAYSGMLKNK